MDVEGDNIKYIKQGEVEFSGLKFKSTSHANKVTYIIIIMNVILYIYTMFFFIINFLG